MYSRSYLRSVSSIEANIIDWAIGGELQKQVLLTWVEKFRGSWRITMQCTNQPRCVAVSIVGLYASVIVFAFCSEEVELDLNDLLVEQAEHQVCDQLASVALLSLR
jgi:hypothetical protein